MCIIQIYPQCIDALEGIKRILVVIFLDFYINYPIIHIIFICYYWIWPWLIHRLFNPVFCVVFSGNQTFPLIIIRPVPMDERESTESQDSSIFRPWEKSSPVRVDLPKSSSISTPSPVSSIRRCYDVGSSPVPYSVSGWPLYSTPVSHKYRENPALQPQMSPVLPGISHHHVTPHHMTSFLSPSSTMSSPVVTAGLEYTGLTTSPVSEADSGYTSASPVVMTTSDDVTNSTMNCLYLGNRKYLNPQAIDRMELWYQDNQQHPYPSISDLNKLAHDGHITVAQVRKWMANKRMRSSNTTSRKPRETFVHRQRRAREVSCPRAVVSSSCSDTADQNRVDHYPRHFTPRVTDILNSWFEKNRSSPYPSEEEKEQLARDTRLTVKQIRYWFANKRTRTLRKHNISKDSQVQHQEQLHQFRQQSVQFLSQLCVQNS